MPIKNKTVQVTSGKVDSTLVISQMMNTTIHSYDIWKQNPIEDKLADRVGEYPYTLGAVIANRKTPISCTHHSKLLQELDYENIQEMIEVKLGEEELILLQEIQKQKVITTDKVNRPAYQKTLKEHFRNRERNDAIVTALEDGYTQAKVAKHLGVSRSLVCKIVRGSSAYSTPRNWTHNWTHNFECLQHTLISFM